MIFNKAMPLESAHMLVAAYLVGGFLIASVYAAAHAARHGNDRYHRLGFVIAFTVAAIATPVQMGVGDALARWVYDDQPVKFAAIELVPQTSDDVPETLLGQLNSDGHGGRRDPDPGPRLLAVRPEAPASPRSSRGSTASRPATGRRLRRSTSSTSRGT